MLQTFGSPVSADWNATSGPALIANKPTLGTTSALNVDTDGTMAADSDARVPSQKAVVTYVAAHGGGGGGGSVDSVNDDGAGYVVVDNTDPDNPVISLGSGVTKLGNTTTGTGSAIVLSVSPSLTGNPTAPTQSTSDNSTNIATTAFVQSIATSAVAGLLKFKGATSCSANPSYPSAVVGDAYIVSVAGKIGGSSGTSVDVGDWYICTTANAGGTEASVGADWAHLEHNLVGALLASNNLSDLASEASARSNLGLGTLATQNGTAPTGTIVGTSDSQALTNKSINGVTPSTSSGSAVFLNGSGSYTTPSLTPAFEFLNATISVSASANALTIALKDNAGSDPSSSSPAVFNFRKTTQSSGQWSQVSATGALSLTIPSGATMGVTSSTAFRLWVVIFDDAGTLRLGVVNCTSSTQISALPQDLLRTTTAISSSSSTIGTVYTSIAITSAAPFITLGYIEWSSTGLTAGSWTTTNLLSIQSMGHGIRKPGDRVQFQRFETSSPTTVTGTTKSASSLTLSMAPISAANLIRVRCDGPAQIASTSNGGFAQIGRSSSSNLIGVLGFIFIGVSGNGNECLSISAMDAPNTIISTAYTVYLWGSGTTSLVFPASDSGGAATCTAAIELEEIMA